LFMGRLASFFILLIVGTVYLQSNERKVNPFRDPQLGSFEGTYTTNHGGLLHICQDGVKVQGYFNDVGIIQGGVTPNGRKVNGQFFLAGYGNCIRGTFELELTGDGVEGFFVCSAQAGVTPIVAPRLNVFRPTDAQCALLWENPKVSGTVNITNTLEGHWEDTNHLPLDLCFRSLGNDNVTVSGSMTVQNPHGLIALQYVTGFHSDQGRIFSGTWFQDFNAGAIMIWLRNNGDIDYTWWTGLIYNDGHTYIDYSQLRNRFRHGGGTIQGPRIDTTYDNCTKQEILERYVLKNLRSISDDDDDNYYYFIDDDYLDHHQIRYFRGDKPRRFSAPSNINSGSSIVASFLFMLIFVILF